MKIRYSISVHSQASINNNIIWKQLFSYTYLFRVEYVDTQPR